MQTTPLIRWRRQAKRVTDWMALSRQAASSVLAVMLMLEVCVPSTAVADENVEAAEGEEVAQAEGSKGILPIPDFSGDLWSRSYLTGDWGGSRDALTSKGVQLDAEYYHYVQDVADGGVEGGDQWGGKANYRLHMDLDKMGVMPGGLIYVRFDARHGDGVIGKTGQLLPANEAFLIPVDFDDLERETWGELTALNYTQFLSPKFAVFLGKIDMMDGDPNEFAAGRGDTQFLNYSMMYAAPTAIVPASTLGAGVMYLPNEHLTIASQVVSATDTTFDSLEEGFNRFDDGQVWATALMAQYRMGDLPGGFNANYLQWFNADFTNISSIVGALESTEDTSWLVALSGWQYLYTEESSEGPLDATNKIPDLQGWGLFARLGFADKDTNPFSLTGSVGLGGRGVIPGRDNDLFGVGYFYTETEDGNVLTSVGLEKSVQGFETFYNVAITPAVKLSFDVQWLEASVPDAEDAWVLGSRLQLVF
ncbi:carbohydrate porin [Marinobacter alexandrii]|uniref:carbohydrate porin n=1 Tax=Marinobacter alexandrii TaxID=2570351 RepID=UPI00329A1411